MSADNGIYILETPFTNPPTEYRVRHLQAIDNLYWDGLGTSDDPDIAIANARKMFAGCVIFTQRTDALDYAADLAESYPILEYGISIIRIPRRF